MVVLIDSSLTSIPRQGDVNPASYPDVYLNIGEGEQGLWLAWGQGTPGMVGRGGMLGREHLGRVEVFNIRA